MKRFSLIVAAMMLLVVFTQCKKDNVTPTSDEGVRITLKATYGGEKTGFNPATCGFVWSATTEYINVGGSKGGYLGQLTGTGDGTSTTIEFSGTLDKAPTSGEKLYFFYLGNGSHPNTSAYTIQHLNISNQTGNLEDVTDYHIAISDAVTYSGQETFNATLNMKMAIAYFNTSGASGDDVYLHGNDIYTKFALNYYNGSFDLEERGYISLPAGSDGYVALLPSTDSETTLKFEISNKTGALTFLRGIKAGYYYSNGNDGLSIPFESVSDDAVKGLFTVASDNKKVRFSKGNLQYTRYNTEEGWSTGAWSFLEHQYEVVETASVSENYASQTAIGLFGWGTSGWNNGNLCYLPNSTSNATTGDYVSTKGYGYGPTDGSKYNLSLTGTYANADWGVSNSLAITNGGGYTTWYTLSSTEWGYLLNTRTSSTINGVENARFARISINSKKGLVIFPDKYTHPDGLKLPTPTSINSNNYLMSSNWTDYSISEWNEMEKKGAVFLPIAGRRNGTSIESSTGYYYTTSNSGNNKATYVLIGTGGANVSNSDNRYYGCSVRLVRE